MLIFTRELKLICRQWYGKLPIFFDIHKCSGMFTLGQVQINVMSANSWKFQQIDLFPHCFAHLHKCIYVFASPILPHNRFHLICQRNDLLDGWELRRKRFHSHRPYEIDYCYLKHRLSTKHDRFNTVFYKPMWPNSELSSLYGILICNELK